jgi:UDP-N-acetylglucosamine pyrophosphorylase
MNIFINTITSKKPEIRNKSFYDLCKNLSVPDLISNFTELEKFRKTTANLYERVRACIFLYAGYRFCLMESDKLANAGIIPNEGYENYLKRNYEKAIGIFLSTINKNGQNSNIFSCLAECYHQLTFQILAEQVRKSVRSSLGNQWMFRVGHFDEHPLKIHPKLLTRENDHDLFPVLQEKTPVRLDLTHSAWSDIFFLGMDYPEGARVINISIDLGVYSRDKDIKPPLECYLRVIAEPVIRLTSLDLKDTKDVTLLSDLFNFGNDYLSLLKAAIIASGIIPPSYEGTTHTLKSILDKLISEGYGIELVTKVNDIPKGSRLAVSTNLLASMISALMRATQQTKSLEGALTEQERRLIASRAILGEWLGGSGGGWQDSGGIWNGVKAIEGALASIGDPEYNISRGCLLPKHIVLNKEKLHPDFEKKITSSLILIHGGMASNVGPILEMVTEKYLLRSKNEWKGRQEANRIYDTILAILKTGDIKKLALFTTRNFEGPVKTIIPWATNSFTETIIEKLKQALGQNYWGFLMLGGMSGGGMGIFVNPVVYNKAKDIILKILKDKKNEMSDCLPFAMDPVVYNFKINRNGSMAKLFTENKALMPGNYYSIQIPLLVKNNPDNLNDIRKKELDIATSLSVNDNIAFQMLRSTVTRLFNFSSDTGTSQNQEQNELAESIKKENGFDYVQHEQIRQDLFKGRIGLSRNRLTAETVIDDVKDSEINFLDRISDTGNTGFKSISSGKVAVLCLAAGVGSRWTKGAGVIKAIHPFIEMKGSHRSFLEIHLAKNRKTSQLFKTKIPFIISTSYLTHQPVVKTLKELNNYEYPGKVYISSGKSIGQRLIPMERDLRFLWEEMLQEQLDENKQKVREAVRGALIAWAKSKGESSDYTDNIAFQRLSPSGHWYEVPNLLRNGVLAKLLKAHPELENIMLHNIDTLGADVSQIALNYHIKSKNALTYEVVPRRMDDRGGGLAKINGKIRLLEGLAQPHDEDELSLRYYNTMTTWINIDKLLELFKLDRIDILKNSEAEISEAVRQVARRMPTYVTIKDVKYRWGHGQEDIYPVTQIEKLWGDMSALPDLKCGYLVVPRRRGQQLKDPDQLDAWVNDGSKEYISSICSF